MIGSLVVVALCFCAGVAAAAPVTFSFSGTLQNLNANTDVSFVWDVSGRTEDILDPVVFSPYEIVVGSGQITLDGDVFPFGEPIYVWKAGQGVGFSTAPRIVNPGFVEFDDQVYWFSSALASYDLTQSFGPIAVTPVALLGSFDTFGGGFLSENDWALKLDAPFTFSATVDAPPVPLPASGVLLMAGLALLGGFARRNTHRAGFEPESPAT